ncbi:extensin [Brucella melitensis]|nr:extensin [Brucella melitensis]
MVLSFSRPSRIFIMVCLTLVFFLAPGLFRQSSTKAQTFIERILKQDAQKAKKYKKRTVQKRSSKRLLAKQAEKPAPQPNIEVKSKPTTPVPVPVPAPRRTEEKAQKEAPAMDEAHEAKPAADKAEPEQQAKPQKDDRIYQVACPALISGDVDGKLLPPIKDGEQCGTHSPLSLTAIGTKEPLRFAHPVTTNCAMAVTLAQWSSAIKKAAKTAYGDDFKITKIGTSSDYQCRRVNGASSGRISEHAFANALDIMSFEFSDGSKTELQSGWNGSDKEKAFWRAVHEASCELFMTVIGPDGDAAHRTNMHLDQGCHGKTCLMRICE